MGAGSASERNSRSGITCAARAQHGHLKQLGAAILAMPTDYPFYLSRKLDLDKDKQSGPTSARSSSIGTKIRSYSRLLATTLLPTLPHNELRPEGAANFPADCSAHPAGGRARNSRRTPAIQAYALEISHHVLGKVGGVAVERPENVVVIIPQAAATCAWWKRKMTQLAKLH